MVNFEELSAIFPKYTDQGDVTELYFKNGQTTELPRKIKSQLHKIAARFACDLTALRNQAKQRTGQTNQQPLLFSNTLLLVPVKVRNCRVPGDLTLAYVNRYAVEKIQSIDQSPYCTEIFLTGNHRILSLWTTKTVLQNIRQANLATLAASDDGQMAILAQKIVELLKYFRPFHA